MSIKIKTKGCTGHFLERYAYNRKTGKCVDYDVQESCFQGYGNEFETRLECLTACNPNSPCLEDNEPQLQHKKRKNPLYYYDSDEDFCFEASPDVAAKNVWPNGNLFLSKKRCIRECKPMHKANGKHFSY
uniref:Putative tick kunitz 1 n=1 Tax=Amblyomma cajennense TaxID=34607 RepID=A0A023FPE3_AMBCJ